MELNHLLFTPPARPFQVGLAGFGEFGRTLAVQLRAHPHLDLVGVCDIDGDATRAALADLGMGKTFVTDRTPNLLDRSPDILVEATGNTEAAVENALLAIEAGAHIAMASKEAESVVGPVLHGRARERGLVYTPILGDQPALLLALIAYARLQGFEIVAAGKASEYDVVFDPAGETLSWLGRTERYPGFADLWAGADALELARKRAARAPWIGRSTPPDLCEMLIVANHGDLSPDTPALHAPLARPLEIPDLFRPVSDGGLLSREGGIDVFTCLRRPDEASFAGGVFVIVRCTDDVTWRVLADKGHPVSSDGKYAMLYNPQHLLGLEVPLTLLLACAGRRSCGSAAPRQRFDLTARAREPWPAGREIRLGRRHTISGMGAEMRPAEGHTGGAAAPYYCVAGSTVARHAAAGDLLTYAHIERDETSALNRMLARRVLE